MEEIRRSILEKVCKRMAEEFGIQMRPRGDTERFDRVLALWIDLQRAIHSRESHERKPECCAPWYCPDSRVRGAWEMVVSLGDGTWHPAAYNQAAGPYNYSDMTGFNERVVNPGLKPLKGYWIVVNDSGNPGQLWNKVSWTADLTNGCAIEVYVRASDDRNGLGSELFTPATNNVFFPAIRGRYIEVRLAMTRDDASKQPVIYDLTLQGVSSGFAGDFFLDDARAYETEDAVFFANITGAEPMGFQWYRMYPWETNWVQVAGATNSYFVVTNVDSWVDCEVLPICPTNGSGF